MNNRWIILLALACLVSLTPSQAGAQFFGVTYARPGFYFSIGSGPYYAPVYGGYYEPVYIHRRHWRQRHWHPRHWR